jgi:G:T-mismatch repair DNA endonuclease (very short patch repair protein)
LSRNTERDKAALDRLRDSGWLALVVWECELKGQGWETRLSDALRPQAVSAD